MAIGIKMGITGASRKYRAPVNKVKLWNCLLPSYLYHYNNYQWSNDQHKSNQTK